MTKIDKDRLFTMNSYTATHGDPQKKKKKKKKNFMKIFRFNVRENTFSNRVVDNWNSLTEDIVNAPSLNAFKSRLNRFWRNLDWL